MQTKQQPPEIQYVRKPEPYFVISSFKKALLAVIFCGTCLLAIMYFTGVIEPAVIIRGGDDLTAKQAQERLAAFEALMPMTLLDVSDDDLPKAINSMQLPQTDQQALDASIARDNPGMATKPAAVTSKTESPRSTALVTKTEHQQLRLVWISLWDTDVEDGDTVQIDSQGYSRTVVLKNAPVTFAIPVPANGILNLTGVRDGDGGGITVGLASGEARATFPIMTVGQVISIKVKTK